MKTYIKPIMNIAEFDFENVITGSGIEPEPQTVQANELIKNLADSKQYKATFEFTF